MSSVCASCVPGASHRGQSVNERYLFRLENNRTLFLVNLFGKYGDVNVSRGLVMIDSTISKFFRLGGQLISQSQLRDKRGE